MPKMTTNEMNEFLGQADFIYSNLIIVAVGKDKEVRFMFLDKTFSSQKPKVRHGIVMPLSVAKEMHRILGAQIEKAEGIKDTEEIEGGEKNDKQT